MLISCRPLTSFCIIASLFGSLEGRRIKELALEPDKRPSVTGDEVRYKKITKKPAPRRSKMAIPGPPKAGSPFCALWTGGWNPKTPKINNFFIPEITLRGG